MSAGVPDPSVPRLGLRPGLTGLRGVAILLVLGLHFFNLRMPGGWVGVDLFFALSGFLITTLLLEELRDTGRIDLKAFYLRRARRLLPAIGVFLLVCCLLLPFVDEVGPMLLTIGTTLLYVANVPAMLGAETSYEHMWSLSLEEQFYFVWPVVALWLVRRHPHSAWRLPLLVAALLAISVPVLNAAGVDGRILYFGPLMHFQPVMLGCFAAMLFASGRLPDSATWWRPALSAASLASLAWILLVAVTWWSGASATFNGVFTVTAVAAVVLTVGGVYEAPGPLAWVLRTWPLQELGRISYSLYIWHQVAAQLIGISSPARALAATAIAVVFAEASYRLVERPILNRKRRSPIVPDVAPEAVPHTLPVVASASDLPPR